MSEPLGPVSGPPSDEDLRSSRLRFAVVLVVVGLVVGGIIIANNNSSSTPTRPATIEVTYKVEGDISSADITYEGPTGIAQQSGVNVPLRRQSDGGEGIKFTTSLSHRLYLSAQNHGDSGDVTCIIEVDGIEITRNTSRGGYTIATCSG